MSCVTRLPPVLARDGKNGASASAIIGSTRGWSLALCRMPSPAAGFGTAGAAAVVAAALRVPCAAGLAAGACRAAASASIGLAAADGEHDGTKKNAAPASAALLQYRAIELTATLDAGRRDEC